MSDSVQQIVSEVEPTFEIVKRPVEECAVKKASRPRRNRRQRNAKKPAVVAESSTKAAKSSPKTATPKSSSDSAPH